MVDGKPAAFVECAKACGLAMVPEEKRTFSCLYPDMGHI